MKNQVIRSIVVLIMTLVLLMGCAGGFSGIGRAIRRANAYQPKLPTAQEEAEIFVAPIEGLSDDFILGMDISSVIAEEDSGVKYYNEKGEEEDLFQLLADAGVNYIRVRVWNNPYDENGNGYGGGNNDVEKAARIGARAADYGMKLVVDFHYSDFWADPNKQFCPVAWRGTEPDEKAKLLYDFTTESLKTIQDGGAEVGMVQIGNEINNGLSSEHSVGDIMTLLVSAAQAVRAVSKDIQIVVHYTEIDDYDGTIQHAQDLADAGVDYDVFGVSYYPYWHGTMENMTKVLTDIHEKFGKETCVMETSYMSTTEDGDGFANSVSEDNLVEGYPASPQGQASCVRDVMAAASGAGALGVFYWEGAWVPVGSDAASNSKLWEKYGSGWASSYAHDYDRMDAGQYYGGCSWDNQAFFDFEGKKLASLDVFKYVRYGAKSELSVMAYPGISIEVQIGEPLKLPESVTPAWNDPSVTDSVKVDWEKAQSDAIDTSIAGEYTVDGVAEDGTKLTASIKVANTNYIKNHSFEDADVSMWEVIADSPQTDIQDKAADALTGDKAFHFYHESAVSFAVEQKVDGFNTGSYTAIANIQGGDMGSDADIRLYVRVNGETFYSGPVELDGWQHWQRAVIKDIPVTEGDDISVGMTVSGDAKGWGTIDDLEFFNQQ